MQSDRDADEHRDSRIYESLNHRSPNIIPFQFYDPVLGQRHSPGLPVPHQHVHLGFHPAQLLQHVVLKMSVNYPQHGNFSLAHAPTSAPIVLLPQTAIA
jgi:hypothetical protein